jgi:hypothetical protein
MSKPKRANLYLRESDVVKIRELTAFIAGEGERTSDSLIVRAALRVAKRGPSFLVAYREVAGDDQRFNDR